MSDGTSLPVVEPPASVEDPVRTGAVAGVLLAAGTSSRFGAANKLLATVDGGPMVRAGGRTLAAAPVSPLIAVLGHEADRVRAALDGLGFDAVVNPDYADGQATSVRTGVEALDWTHRADSHDGTSNGDADADADAGVEAAVFALGDMPFVRRASIEALVRAYRAGLGTALAAACDGRRGNPVLFDAAHVDALADVGGDVGGRDVLLSSEGAALVETGDPGVLRDVDRPTDLDGE
jgi:molybdenum cofactor cytidylyltransferase